MRCERLFILEHDPDNFLGRQILSTDWYAGRYVSTKSFHVIHRTNIVLFDRVRPSYQVSKFLPVRFAPRSQINHLLGLSMTSLTVIICVRFYIVLSSLLVA